MPLTFKDMATEAPPCLEMWVFHCFSTFRHRVCVMELVLSLCYCKVWVYLLIFHTMPDAAQAFERVPATCSRFFGTNDFGQEVWDILGRTSKNIKKDFLKNWKTISLPPFLFCDSYTFRIFRQISFANA